MENYTSEAPGSINRVRERFNKNYFEQAGLGRKSGDLWP